MESTAETVAEGELLDSSSEQMLDGESNEVGHGTTTLISEAAPAIDVMGVTGLDVQPTRLRAQKGPR